MSLATVFFMSCFGYIGLRILLKMELTSLPFRSREARGQSRLDPLVIVRRDALNAVESSALQILEEGSPVDLGLREGHARAEHGPFAVLADADGHENGAVHNRAAVSNLLVSRIHDQIRRLAEISPDARPRAARRARPSLARPATT